MSRSSFKVGRHIAHDLIAKADTSATQAHTWDTNDLGDFVEGLVVGALEELEFLRPEQFEHDCALHQAPHG